MPTVPHRIRFDLSRRKHEGTRPAPLTFRDLIHATTRRNGCHVFFEDRCAVFLDGMIVMMLDQQPICALASFPVVSHPDQHKASMQALTFERELEVALSSEPPAATCYPPAPSTRDPGAAAILSFRDRALEIAVVERMVFHLDGKALVMRIKRRTLRHRPGPEDPSSSSRRS